MQCPVQRGRRLAWPAAALAVTVLATAARADCLAVIPVLYGPLQILVAVLPAILGALGATLLALLRPSAIRTGAQLLWRSRLLVAGVIAVVAAAYLAWNAATTAKPAGDVGHFSEGQWPAFRGGPERRGWVPGDADPAPGPVVWTLDETRTFYSSPAAAGGRLYVASADKNVFSDRGAVYCLDAQTGAVVWKYAPDDFRATFSSPAVGEGCVVVGEGLHYVRDGRITCLDAATGRLRWQLRTASHVESSPCIYNGRAYIGAGDDGLYAVALEPTADGSPRVLWHLEGRQYPDCEASPLAHEGRVYFALGEGGSAVCAVDAETGHPVWRTPTPYPVFTAPTLAEGRIFVGMGVGNYIESAAQLWEKRLAELRRQGKTEAEIAEARRRHAPAGAVWALDAGTGQVVAQTPLGDTVLGSLAAADGRLYFADRSGVCRMIDLDGKVLAEWNARQPILAAPAAGRTHLFLITETGRLYALDRQTLMPAWDFTVDTEGPCLSSPAVAWGHIYVGSAQKGLVCLGRPAGCAGMVWAGRLGGAGRRGCADGAPPPALARLLWQYDAADTSSGVVPAYLEGFIYLAARQDDKPGLACIATAARPGEPPRELWFYATGKPPYGSPVADGRLVYFVDGPPGSADRRLHAVDAAAGRPAWTAPIEPAAPGDLALADGLLIVADGADRISAYRPGQAKAEAAWSQKVGALTGPPAVSSGQVLACTSAGEAVSLDCREGRVLWRRSLPASPSTGPVANDDFAAVGTADGAVALSLVDGSILWQARCGEASALACDERRLACTTGGGHVVVLDWLGRQSARYSGGRTGFEPTLCGRQVAFCTARSIEQADGEGESPSVPVIEADWLGWAAAPPLLVKSHLYLLVKGMGLVCLGPENTQ